MNLLPWIVPAFCFFVFIEYMAALYKKKAHLFSYETSIANISVGIAERLLNLFLTGSFYGLYVYLHQKYALWNIPNAWWVWVLLLLATDFVWYWYHRLGHEINLFWGAHIVHHQSEEFNFTVSARITTIQALVRNVFWCVLPLAGFDPLMVIVILAVHGAYSFFTHTQVIGKLGWVEHILITPSHHGVHHASNEKYLNKNYGDIFVFWDKMFGTFQREEEKPIYGLTHPLKSYSFLWQHFHYYAEIWEACRRSGSLRKSWQIIFGKPEELDQNIRPSLERALFADRPAVEKTLRFKMYLNLQVVACLVGLFFFTYFLPRLTFVDKVTAISLFLLTLVNIGALLEQRRWIFWLEIVRLIIVLTYYAYLEQSFLYFVAGMMTVLVLSAMESIERRYFQWVYNTRE